ncbi:hypothetical protein [Moraxella bovis]|uniref:Uncharacterized protein n=1 Tax=Moraxella bovis TaxID=476 RepID=A0A378PZJ6_MORBO|nr:hypothetical protein [Moraxella bovis]UZA28364.1 hypothetical protein LP119_05255 [Moraxella bovis]UZA39109.1 hypothetical protein LP101_06100 [Moraxella bovis]STY93187.1 Uncharacterised protein [Moraxella bovis]STY93388.1 Uncharacterised protein [Moraxella bovis]
MNLNTAKALIDKIGLDEAKNIAENEPSNAFIFLILENITTAFPARKNIRSILSRQLCKLLNNTTIQ